MILHKIIIANSVVEGQATKSVQLLKESRIGRIECKGLHVKSKSVLYRTTNKKTTESMRAEATPKVRLVVCPEGRTTTQQTIGKP